MFALFIHNSIINPKPANKNDLTVFHSADYIGNI